MKKQTVFVGLSGGVDSSVSAALLLEQGYRVVGVFIKVWHPDFMVCNWEAERVDAMRVAAHLGIPFMTCDAEATYKAAVADYFIDSYRRGYTPNPDVLCNKAVKFGAFLDFARAQGADFIATGHYAQVTHTPVPVLKRGIDTNKDQSYFLWTLTGSQLAQTLFPIGHLPKEEVRALAARYKLPTATKKDSQGICFLGHVDIPEFLSHYLTLEAGDVTLRDGTVIGNHEGVLVYTIGQRHGFTITHQHYASTIFYVVGKDVGKNRLIVATEKPQTHVGNVLSLDNLILRTPITVDDMCEVQTRYRQTPIPARVVSITDTTCEVALLATGDSPAVGQSCVLYRDEVCVGGGMIASCHT